MLVKLAAVVIVLGHACEAIAGAAAEVATPSAQAAPARIHGDGTEMERAVLDVVLSCLRDEGKGAVAGMDRIAASCRTLSRDRDPAIHRDVILYDQALHAALAKSRDLAVGRHMTETFDQFVWVMRACRSCHQMARTHGLMPETNDAGGPGAGH